MSEPDLAEAAMHLSEQVLIWIGFGTVVGLLAKAIMPGRDPGGTLATLFMGIAGSVIGCAVLLYITGGERITPISPLGFLVGTGGAFVILFFYRLLGGYFFIEGQTVRRPYGMLSPRRRRRARNIVIEE
jgi:uncharacterized membrane protein YeaQ/YmgE (transglycosylase-associated protein family)